MADITMCANNNECNKKDTCYRNLATKSAWQSYATFYDHQKGKCDYYWEVDTINDVNDKNIKGDVL